ncbi:hypothetical protein BOTBODRAFT_174876 [Botryobasidium botryosum FD-172 SS1]|uniref:Uncharacterized protein n=1 Tax=Botryobasidium botryosum (strain FD-172 SS1) TaxID=930990 RepID=A0A067MI70_BOTB1|nr:hypothetical protein BOTBODRAFT_174876 [Botryobasidium botryosum FD-172 SS1]
MASSDPRNFYKVDPASVDPEALAQRQARYLKIHAEETEGPRRVELRPKGEAWRDGGMDPFLLVPLGSDPDAYLDGVELVGRLL